MESEDWRELRDAVLEIQHRLRVDGASLEKALKEAQDLAKGLPSGKLGDLIFSKAESVSRDMKAVREMLDKASTLAGEARDTRVKLDYEHGRAEGLTKELFASHMNAQMAKTTCQRIEKMAESPMVIGGRVSFSVTEWDRLRAGSETVLRMLGGKGATTIAAEARVAVDVAIEHGVACPWCKATSPKEHGLECPFAAPEGDSA